MSLRGHGNWCGPGWSAGQWKDAKDLTDEDRLVPAIDELDQACKQHDLAIADAKDADDLERANKEFEDKARSIGIKGAVFAQLVHWFGPGPGTSFSNLPWGAKNYGHRGPNMKSNHGAAQLKLPLQIKRQTTLKTSLLKPDKIKGLHQKNQIQQERQNDKTQTAHNQIYAETLKQIQQHLADTRQVLEEIETTWIQAQQILQRQHKQCDHPLQLQLEQTDKEHTKHQSYGINQISDSKRFIQPSFQRPSTSRTTNWAQHPQAKTSSKSA